MSVAAILGSWDTKRTEMRYMRSRLEAGGIQSIYIDMSTMPTEGLDPGSGYSSQEVRKGSEEQWESLAEAGRGAKIDFMAEMVKNFVLRSAAAGEIQGVVSAGGLQNTTLATTAMKALPAGFPKVMATTAATGLKPFNLVVGQRDIVVIPALADLAGENFVTRSTLNTACDCLIGLMSGAATFERPKDKPVVGFTLMGVTNNSGVGAVLEFDSQGYESVGFHATGTGGGVMEEFVSSGFLDGVLDLNLHELSNEYFGGGYSYSVKTRLIDEIEMGVPLVLTPGGLDFVDFYMQDFKPGMEGRQYVVHNSTLAHIKLTIEEAVGVGTLVGTRIAKSERKIPFLVPTEGLRAESGVGEKMHNPAVDEALIETIIDTSNGMLDVERIPLNLNTIEFGRLAAQRYIELYQAVKGPVSSNAEVLV